MDHVLKFNDHISDICSKARQRAALILKCFTSRDPTLLMHAFTAFVRPTLEYASCVWSPYNITLIKRIESVQKRFTKRLSGFCNIPYNERLIKLKIDSLEKRRLMADLIMYFKILNGYVDFDAEKVLTLSGPSVTRGHAFKLVKPVCKSSSQLNWFNYRSINVWNNLMSDVVSATSPFMFKRKLSSCQLTTASY
jgi:hypothetical protein